MSKVVTSSTGSPSTSCTHIPHDKIAMRAHDKWCKRGRPHGTDKQDWLEAEAELRQELGQTGCSPQQGHTQGRR